MIKKLSFKEINDIVELCGLTLDLDCLASKPFFGVHHIHEWDHGYESDAGYNGSRREFYADMRDMLNFLLDYAKITGISSVIIAPLFCHCQFSLMNSYPEKSKSLRKELHGFLKSMNIRDDSRCGVMLDIHDDINIVEMVLEGSFLDDISNLRILLPSQKVILDLTHHFDLAFFTPDFDKEKSIVTGILEKHPNLKYYERNCE